jgi:hypothetical protein
VTCFGNMLKWVWPILSYSSYFYLKEFRKMTKQILSLSSCVVETTDLCPYFSRQTEYSAITVRTTDVQAQLSTEGVSVHCARLLVAGCSGYQVCFMSVRSRAPASAMLIEWWGHDHTTYSHTYHSQSSCQNVAQQILRWRATRPRRHKVME